MVSKTLQTASLIFGIGSFLIGFIYRVVSTLSYATLNRTVIKGMLMVSCVRSQRRKAG